MGRRIRVLVVDDDLFVRRATCRQLTPDFDVVEAEGGDDAVAALRGERIDAIVLDLDMPFANGCEVYRELVRIDPTLATRVIILSGGTADVELRTWAETFRERFLAKPVDNKVIVEAIARLVEAEAAMEDELVADGVESE